MDLDLGRQRLADQGRSASRFFIDHGDQPGSLRICVRFVPLWKEDQDLAVSQELFGVLWTCRMIPRRMTLSVRIVSGISNRSSSGYVMESSLPQVSPPSPKSLISTPPTLLHLSERQKGRTGPLPWSASHVTIVQRIYWVHRCHKLFRTCQRSVITARKTGETRSRQGGSFKLLMIRPRLNSLIWTGYKWASPSPLRHYVFARAGYLNRELRA